MKAYHLGVVCLLLVTVASGADRADKPPEWTTDLSKMTPPEHAARGRIHGKEFVADRAVLKGGVLTLRQGGDFFPDLALDVMAWIKQDESPEGKKVRVEADDERDIPWLRLAWREVKGKGLPETENYQKGYALVLELGKREQGRIPGKIYACFTDKEKSVVAGTFMVEEVEEKK